MISVVLPCYNPVDGWCQTLLQNVLELNAALPQYHIEYIVSNDGSTRLNRGVLTEITATSGILFVDNLINEGKGSAIRKGTMHAKGDIVIYTDIDFPFGTQPIVDMVNIFATDPQCWFVYGNRNVEYFRKLPFKRQVVSKALQLLNKLFLSRHVTDTQAGIKGFRREILPEILQTKTNTFVFEIELIRKLIKKKIEIRSIDVAAKPTIVFSDFSYKVLFRETISLWRIIFMSSVWGDI